MSDAKIFLLGDGGDNLLPMTDTPYPTEDMLQALLARYPDLLPGDQIDPENPRRWLLVSREVGVPGDAQEGNRWSLDHLFLDQDAISTFVECKRASDTRSRREVVAQMLDYAANGIEYWSMDRLRQAAAETASRGGNSLDDQVRQFIGVEDATDIEPFWQQVEANLRSGRVRLIFATDETPKELRRLVEFLNEKMADVEVLAVEVKQFVGERQRALVPRVIGLTEAGRVAKRTGAKVRTSRDQFLAKCPQEIAQFFETVLDQAQARGHTIYWGTAGFSLRARFPAGPVTFLEGYPPAKFDFKFGDLPTSNEERAALCQELEGFGAFERTTGKYMRAELEADGLPRMQETYRRILDRVEDLARLGGGQGGASSFSAS